MTRAPSRSWLCERCESGVVLRRPANGTTIEIDELASEIVDDLTAWPNPKRFSHALARIGEEQAQALMEILESHEAVCAVESDATEAPTVIGAEGLTLPAYLVGEKTLTVVRMGGSLMALIPSETCPSCAILRGLARQLEEEEPPTRIQACLVEELVHASTAAPLRPGEVLWLEADRGVERGFVVPHPDCTVATCASRTGTIAAREVTSSPLAPFDVWDFEDDRNKPDGLPQEIAWGAIHLTRAGACTITHVRSERTIYGAAHTQEEARRIALSECIERLATRGANAECWAAAEQLPDAMTLTDAYSFIRRQDLRNKRAWCRGTNVITGKATWIPLELVRVGISEAEYPQAIRREQFYCGTASHVSFEQALVNATVELLTRDAYLLAWYRQQPLARVSPPDVTDASLQRSLAWQKFHGIRFELFDLEPSTLPVALLGRLTSEREHPNWPKGGVVLIPGGGFSVHEAFSRVLNHSSLRLLNLVAAPSEVLDPKDPETVARVAQRHPYYPLLARYLDPRNIDACSFIDSGRTCRQKPDRSSLDAVERVQWLREVLEASRLSWLTVDLTDAVASALGFKVAKSIIPGTLRLARSREEVDLGLPRLLQSLRGSNSSPHPWPHPMV